MPSRRATALPAPAASADGATRLLHAPYRDTLPEPLVFRTEQMPAQASYPRHRHAWGELVYAFAGLMEIRLGAQTFLAPPQCGIWLPPDTEHRGLTRGGTRYSSLYVSAELCAALPATTCALAVSPLLRSLLEHLRDDPPVPPASDAQRRLLQVAVDQLALARPVGSWLPRSDDAQLATVLQWLNAQPGDERSLAELAAAVHSTERTLSRRCRRDLGMSFAEWRQRLRVVKALPRLEAGEKVAAIALDLGYANPSAFIAMFRRLTGLTPDQHRQTRGASSASRR